MKFLLPIIIFLFAGFTFAQTRPATEQDEMDRELSQIRSEVAGYPIIRLDSIEQVLTLNVEGDMVDARTSLNAMGGDAQLMIPGWQSILRMTFYTQRNRETNERFFMLMDRDLTDIRKGIVYTTVVANNGRVFITRDSESRDNGLTSVQYIQDPPSMEGEMREDPPARLYVNRTNPIPGQPMIAFILKAPDFATLRRQHRGILDQFLRPILRDLHQEAALFAISRNEGWQVLGQDSTPGPVAMERINAIIPRLGNENFRERERAAEEIRQLGPLASIALKNIDRGNLTLQQSSAIQALTEEWSLLPADEAQRLLNDKSFMIDVLYTEDADLRQRALDRLRVLTGNPVSLDPSPDAKSRAAAVAKLREQLTPTTQPTTSPSPSGRGPE